jgi:sortase A
MLSYPTISDMVARSKQSEVIHNYTTTIQRMDQDELDEKRQKAEEYNAAIAAIRDRIELPAALQDRLEVYEQALNENGVVGYLDMQSIHVHIPIYHGTSDKVLSQGVGHLSNTPLPTGKLGDHTALAGHTGLVGADLFNELHNAQLGDTFILYVLEEKLTYEVDQMEIVAPENTSLLDPDPDLNLVTLITCTPQVVNTHRLLVRGHLVSKEKIVAADPDDSMQVIGGSLGVATAVAGAATFIADNGPSAAILLVLLLVLRDSYKRRRQMRRQAGTLLTQLHAHLGKIKSRVAHTDLVVEVDGVNRA